MIQGGDMGVTVQEMGKNQGGGNISRERSVNNADILEKWRETRKSLWARNNDPEDGKEEKLMSP